MSNHKTTIKSHLITTSKWFLLGSLALLSIVALIRGFERLNDDFAMRHIQIEIPYHADWILPAPESGEQALINQILAQRFVYLARGHQSYVFISEDNKYVIKLLKLDRLKVNPLFSLVPLPSALENWHNKKKALKQGKLEHLLNSWQLAYTNLRNETGLIAMQIIPNNFYNQELVIIDKLGFEHRVDLNETMFLIQKKTALLAPTINQQMIDGKEDEAKRLLAELISLYHSEYRRGIAENDSHPLRNTGVIDNHPIQIDFGQFIYDEKLHDNDFLAKELRYKTKELVRWLEKNHPSLAEYFKEIIKESFQHE